ncbi:MAG TPA: sigma-70 family RNA polymerase sigma factor [Steroidobacteraceae bacterium]|jgi:RNA polymerase sigma factor (sigma-70 family)|nr:sigma-70 family RNA polymerase sigma factor [Steroidobacteraceae bacterium]
MQASPEQKVQFLELLTSHRGLLYKVSRVYGRCAAERADLVQEVVLNLWQAHPRYDSRLKFSTWMYRIALNVAISWRRRETTQTQHLVPAGEEILENAADLETVDAGTDSDLALLYTSIERLDELDQALLVLYLDGLSHHDISVVLGISTTNIATKIGRLKQRLRDDFRVAGHL